MIHEPTARADVSLDPADWNELRSLGHRMLDEMLDWLETTRERPVWTAPTEADRAPFRAPLPVEPEGAERAYDAFRRTILPHPLGNTHPRFWGWVTGAGSPFGMLAEMVAAGFNSPVAGFNQVAVDVELQVVDWLAQMLGYPTGASGVLTTGGSVANLIALAVARNERAGWDVAAEGVAAGPSLAFYCSTETHNSVEKAMALLGLGRTALRRIPVGPDYRIDLAALESAIAADRRWGVVPVAVVGNAGTVNTGAFDDLAALADLSASEGLWYHVDGAFGALAALDPDLRELTHGMERADSLAFYLHKWLSVPYESGCVLVRERAAHEGAFKVPASYLSSLDRGLGAREPILSYLGPELSRAFRALKVWMLLKEHGSARYAAVVRQTVELARHLAGRVARHPRLELLAPVPLNVVNLRYSDLRLEPAALDALNREILMRLHESGVAVPSHTLLRGRFAIRAALVSHRSRAEDVDLLVDEVVRLGDLLSGR